MLLLDTNILSELMREHPDANVLRWVDDRAPADLWISAITAAEIRLGVALLPEGRRKATLAAAVDDILDGFAALCVAFDLPAAREYALIVAARRSAGRPMSTEDAQIAAIARSAGLTLATRNAKDFEDIDGLTVVNPWTDT